MQRGLYMLPANGMIQEDRYISAGRRVEEPAPF